MYSRAMFTNVLTSFIFPLKTWGLVTSTLLPCCWRSMVLTCCYRVAIIARSCSSLEGVSLCCCWDILYSGDDGDSDSDDSYSNNSWSRVANYSLYPTGHAIFTCLDSYRLTDYCFNQIWYTIASKERTPILSGFLRNNHQSPAYTIHNGM